VAPVQLEEPWPLAICAADIFDAVRACRGEAVGQVQLGGDVRDGEFARGVVDPVDADGCEADGGGDAVVEDGGARVASGGVD
jgi:hypothetical protein